MIVSVLISTHRPHSGRLTRTLDGLLAQRLPTNKWELVLVDNASPEPLQSADFRLNRHPNAKLVREERLGLTYGRLAGIQHSRGEILVFVDDDNVLSPDYLSETIAIFDRLPKLGLGGGKCIPEWEVAPEPWVTESLGNLALRDLGEKEQIAEMTDPPTYPRCAPVGAGLIARRQAITPWVDAINQGGDVVTGRKGQNLTSGEDSDIVMCALRAGWEVGYFPQLSLTHLIPAGRVSGEYLARLNYGIAKSWVQVLARHGMRPWPPVARWTVPLRKWRSYVHYRAWAGPAEYIRWKGACGQFEGRALIRN